MFTDEPIRDTPAVHLGSKVDYYDQFTYVK